jgi:ribose transport system permease protein
MESIENCSANNIKTERFTMPKIDYSKFAPLLALIVLIIISALLSDHFLVPRNLTNVLRQVSYTGIIALGMTFVIIAGGIDLSVGSMVALVGVITVSLINTIGGDGWTAVVIGLGAAVVLGAVFGAVNGLLVTRGKVAAFVATLATMSIFRSLTLYFSDAGEVVSHNSHYPDIGGGYLLLRDRRYNRGNLGDHVVVAPELGEPRRQRTVL